MNTSVKTLFLISVAVSAAVAAAPAFPASSAKLRAPRVSITGGPSGLVASTSAMFSFTSNGSSAFKCSRDGAAVTACTSPILYSGLAQGSHSFRVQASNTAGTGSDSQTWTVDTVAPAAPVISSRPADPSTFTSATFVFADSDPSATFRCSLDGATASTCSSPKSYSTLSDGTHSFAVTAKDTAGNSSPQTAASWRIDSTPPPAPTISSATPDASGANASFSFGDSDPTATFRCSIDNSAFAACTTPAGVGALSDGTHVWGVRAVDTVGNQSSAATETWTSATTAPTETQWFGNGSFESGTAGWGATSATLGIVGDGNVGPSAAKITLAATPPREYFLYATTRPVLSTVAGTTYTVTGYARSDTPGKTVCTRIREYTDNTSGTRLGEVTSCLTTTGAWQAFASLPYTAKGSGGTLALQVYGAASTAAAGDSFEVDGLSMTSPAASSSAPPVMISSNNPIIGTAGDVACSPTDSRYNGGNGTGTACMQKATADLLGTMTDLTAILPLGDQVYQCGELANFNTVYNTTWGRFKSIEKPVAGNHEYGDTAACAPSNAAGYYAYFGAAAGDPTKGYYSYNIGTWHLIALNSNCAAIGGCGAGSPQETWLKADLAGSSSACTIAYWHHPRFSAGQTGDDTRTAALWTDLVNAHADLVLSGHDHTYQRFAPMDSTGNALATGVRELIVGTGGEEHHALPLARPTLQVSDNTTFGILRLTLAPNAYAGQFVPASGAGSFTDSFTGSCN
jgi:calcineurin-like phosphoesterase family protein